MTLLRHAGVLVAGVVVSFLAVLVYRSVPPWGLLLAVVASLAPAWRLVLGRFPGTATSYVVGWLLMLGVVVTGRPEGDYAVTADLRGYTLMGTGLTLVVFALVGFAGTRDPSP